MTESEKDNLVISKAEVTTETILDHIEAARKLGLSWFVAKGSASPMDFYLFKNAFDLYRYLDN